MTVPKIPLSLIAFFLGSAAAFAQSPEPKLSPDQPTVVVNNHGWSDQGELVLSILISAPTGKKFALGFLSDKEEVANEIFTTKESYLVDTRTKQVLHSLQKFPVSPNFGRVKSVAVLNPGETLQFTGAYPKPPEPPVKPNGQHEDYEFTLNLPAKVPPVTFTLPYEGNAVKP